MHDDEKLKKKTVKKTRHPFLTNFRGREGSNPGGWRERTLSWPPVPGDPHTMMKICILYSGEINDITTMQDDMTKFRPKLGAILLSSKLNKKGRSLVQPINEAKECSDDFVMLSSPKQVSAQTVMKTKTMIAAVQVAAQRSKRATRNTTTTVEAVQAMSAELVTTMEEVNEMLAKVEAAKAVTEATVASDAAAMAEAVPVLEAEATANEAVPEAEATTNEATGAAITVVQKGKDDNETDELLLSSGMEDIKLTVNISAVIVGISPTLVVGRELNQLKSGGVSHLLG